MAALGEQDGIFTRTNVGAPQGTTSKRIVEPKQSGTGDLIEFITDDPLYPPPPPIVPVTLGWQCPKCGQVYAPFVGKCEYCVPRTVSSTTFNLAGWDR